MAPVLLFLSFAIISFEGIKAQLWPLPRSYTNGSDGISVCSSNFLFNTNAESDILNNAIARFETYIANPAPIQSNMKLKNKKSPTASLCTASITILFDDESLSLSTNENYTLSVSSTSISISAPTVYGAMYALTTLQQLIGFDPITNSNIIASAPWTISDYPAFKHRGVMIDPSRNFLSVSMIKKVLNGMAMNKLNVLHIHLIDAQSFPFYSKSHPELSQKGAYSQDEVYHPSDLTEIVSYAKNLGIRIIPEFDTPGHTFAIQYADPNIMECVSVQDSNPTMCPEPPCGYLDAANESSYSTILDVYMDAFEIFDDSYFHIGGDEVKDACWGSDANEIFTLWISQMCNNVNLVGQKTPIIWSGDVVTSAQIGQNSFDVVIQNWGTNEDKLTALKNGFKVIDSPHTAYYLDCGFGSWLTGGNSWCDPYKTWLTIYNYDLTEGVPTEYLKNVYGGEVCLWGESVDDNNLQPRLWPRAAAAAERWWTDKASDDLNNLFYRMAIQRDWMVHQGIIASPVQPRFCTLHPSYCDYYRDELSGWKRKLSEYQLDEFVDEFEENGWDMMDYWNDLSYSAAKEMGFKQGHWNKFKHLLKELNQNRPSAVDEAHDYSPSLKELR